MRKMPLFVFSSLFFSLSASASVFQNWHIADQTQATSFTKAGSNHDLHEFGILKHNTLCHKDELYLSWSSNSPAVWSLSGKRIKVRANFDGVELDMPLEVVAIRELRDNKHQLILSHLQANKAVIDIIGSSHSVKLSMPAEDTQVAKALSIEEDYFSLSGFVAARQQAEQRCQQQTQQLLAAAK